MPQVPKNRHFSASAPTLQAPGNTGSPNSMLGLVARGPESRAKPMSANWHRAKGVLCICMCTFMCAYMPMFSQAAHAGKMPRRATRALPLRLVVHCLPRLPLTVALRIQLSVAFVWGHFLGLHGRQANWQTQGRGATSLEMLRNVERIRIDSSPDGGRLPQTGTQDLLRDSSIPFADLFPASSGFLRILKIVTAMTGHVSLCVGQSWQSRAPRPSRRSCRPWSLRQRSWSSTDLFGSYKMCESGVGTLRLLIPDSFCDSSMVPSQSDKCLKRTFSLTWCAGNIVGYFT